MKLTLRHAVTVAGAALLAVSFGVGQAQADPSGAPQFRQLAGVGSDTTQDVTNGLSQVVVDGSGTKLIGSYDATGSATINTKSAAACQGIARPNGSGAGRTALLNSLNANDGCIQFARSSSGPAGATTPGLTYVPFATDAVSFAITGSSTLPRSLSKAELQSVYRCEVPGITPYLPQAGSGTRSFWTSYIGSTNIGPCVVDAKNGTPVQEHDGRVLDNNSIVPFSIAQWISQASGVTPDSRGSSVLGVIDNTQPLLLNGSFAVTRPVYNIIPTAQVGTAPFSTVFVGPTSLICQQASTITRYGFAINPNCGSTATTS